MHRSSGQGDLGRAWLSPGLGRNVRLERIGRVFDWSSVERLVAEVYAAKRGRPSWPPLMMVKALLLQQWYGLSDPGLEEALGDRLSFRAFVGLSLEEGSPDHSVLSRFRKALRDKGLDRRLFEEIERQLEAQSLLVKTGTLMDATLVGAAVKKPPSPAGSRSKTDPDADWTRKGNKTWFGYKAHLGVDEGSGLIRRAELTSAKVGDSLIADKLICGDERAVYADKAYEHKDRRRRLKAADQGPDHAPQSQEPVSAAALAGHSQSADQPHPLGRRTGLRNPQARIRLPTRPIPRHRSQPPPPAPALHRLQSQEGRTTARLSKARPFEPTKPRPRRG